MFTQAVIVQLHVKLQVSEGPHSCTIGRKAESRSSDISCDLGVVTILQEQLKNMHTPSLGRVPNCLVVGGQSQEVTASSLAWFLSEMLLGWLGNVGSWEIVRALSESQVWGSLVSSCLD